VVPVGTAVGASFPEGFLQGGIVGGIVSLDFSARPEILIMRGRADEELFLAGIGVNEEDFSLPFHGGDFLGGQRGRCFS